MRHAFLALILFSAGPAFADSSSAPGTAADVPVAYPETRRDDTVYEQFGVKVADPYRWLENDVRTDHEVADWVAQQNRVTEAYLATLPGRQIFAARLRALYDYERIGTPQSEGGRYFYRRNSGLQNQAVLYVRDSLNGTGRVLIDPNTWSADGATALSEWVPSSDGKRLLYAIQDGGSDWRTLKVLDVDKGIVLEDKVEWVKAGDILPVAWAKDGSGFYYSRFPEPAKGHEFQVASINHEVYFHRIGTAQSADPLVFATPQAPDRVHVAEVTDDGAWLVISSFLGSDPNRNQVTLIDLRTKEAKPRTVVEEFNGTWTLVGNRGSRFWWKTNKDAPRGSIIAMDVTSDAPVIREVVREDEAVLQSAALIGEQVIATYLVDAKSEVRRFAPSGELLGKIALPGIGTVSGFERDADASETFFAFTSFTTPTTVYRYDLRADKVAPWAAPKVLFDPADYIVEQQFYASKDGTRVPMFIVRRKEVTGPAPTLLYAYGGFNISILPSFSATRLAWLEQGGVLAVPNIRGGGEYGQAWHDGGRLLNKQNAFDDFIAAGEFLIAKGITGRNQLAIEGRSNGGLLIGAVTNQRPELFAAALPAVGVMDMLRFDRFTTGRFWVGDYGSPSNEADFHNLFAYSPYHNIRAGHRYPAILATTADTDDRVVPGHTFKYAAALQAVDIGERPHLARIETRAGHGSGKPTEKIIAETADLWAFAAKWTGLTVRQVQ
jgi:prolyl oligopeptidase